MQPEQIHAVYAEEERYEVNYRRWRFPNPFAESALHGWHNDRDYVGPYGFPVDLAFCRGKVL